MTGTKYKLLTLISHPVPAFFFFGAIIFLATFFLIYQYQEGEWKNEKNSLDSIKKLYQIYNSSNGFREEDKHFKAGRFLLQHVRTLTFNTRDTQSECISRLSQLDMSFNDKTIIRICKNKLPSMGEYAGKDTATTFFPILSPLDELQGVIVRTTTIQDRPTLFQTLLSLPSIALTLLVTLLAAVLGSLLSFSVKKYLIEIPTTARYDDLTGYLRRDAFFHAANKVLHIANVTKRPACVMLIDIDHFKSVNDTLGHGGGDEALRMTADALKHTFRQEEVFGRIGGDEFAIVLPNITLDNAGIAAERARRAVCNIDTEAVFGNKITLSVSIGLVEYRIAQEDLARIMRRADEKLYQAKQQRNRVAS